MRWNWYSLVVSCDACGATAWPWRHSYAQLRLGELLNRSASATWWLGGDRVALSAGYHPTWRGFRLAVYDNGGRDPREVLDLNAQLGRVGLGVTLWPIGRLAWLLRWLPRGPRGDGFTFGWLPHNEG